MSGSQKLYAWLPKLTGAILLTLTLCIFFFLYFYNYIPGQQQLLNGRAFRELEQIGTGLQNKNDGYSNAIHWFLKKHTAGNPLHATFQFTDSTFKVKDSLYARPMTLDRNTSSGWQLDYPICRFPDSAVVTNMSKGLPQLIQPLIATYRDIFTDYILLRNQPSSDEIVFSSGMLPTDYQVDLDSLMKNNNGFNLVTIHDITIEGTPYKLFLYPLQLGTENVALAGLIDAASYKKSYNTLPLNMVVWIGALVLLLFMHLPVLKIYLLSKTERIRAFDLRMVIITYFLASFMVFFLFSRVFLNHVQSMNNFTRLQDLSTRIETSFDTEIDSICRQLRYWDTATGPDSTRADIYPYGDYVYWIDSAGTWDSYRNIKRRYRAEKLDVHDRTYFQDFMQHNLLTLPGRDQIDSFTIQPTLSRLDGEYTINVLTPSNPANGRNSRIVGLSTEMYSVDNPLMPFGYNFSIIDNQGNILYDSKPGRALLSNMARETGSSSEILAPLRFHSKRYFSSFILQGKPHALLVTPMKGLPYALLVYYDLSGSDDFQEHLLWLPGFFGAVTLLLLILSALIKEQAEKRSPLLKTPMHRFEWLQPTRHKRRYYIHQLWSTIAFMVLFGAIWIAFEIIKQPTEFALFFISMLFPFYMALHYSLIREKERKKLNPPLLVFLGLVIVTINMFACLGTRSSFLPLLVAQLILLTMMVLSVRSFHPDIHPTDSGKKWLPYYVLAIGAGIVSINILPIFSMFWIGFRQESLVQSNTFRLVMASSLNDRRTVVNQRIADYRLSLPDHSDTARYSKDSQDLHRLKFEYGIYTLPSENISTAAPEHRDTAWPISPAYTQLHRWLFPGDSTALAWPANPNYSTDSSWVFLHGQSRRWPGPELLYFDQRDAIESVPEVLRSDKTDAYSALGLMIHETFSEASHFYFVVYFGGFVIILALLLLLTYSLAKRVYVLDLVTQPFRDRLPTESWIGALRRVEVKCWKDPVINEQQIVRNVEKYHTRYSNIWNSLNDIERFTLYDFAEDGFTNYKNSETLIHLINRNILIIDGECIKFMTPGFREWILRQSNDPAFLNIASQQGTWENIKKPLLLLLAIPGIFIFITQDGLLQKITGFLTALAPMIQLVKSFFPPSSKQEKE